MHRKLPEVLNLSIFSFLSSKELRSGKLININRQKAATSNLLWKLFLKKDFSVDKKDGTAAKK